MGCDIHLVMERRKKAAKWIGIYCSDIHPGTSVRAEPFQHNYALFAEIACVRGSTDTSKYARNIPEDVSELAWQQYMQAPTDHHTPSYMTLQEFADAWFRVQDRYDEKFRDKTIRREHAIYDLFNISDDWPEDCEYRVVFWFDN